MAERIVALFDTHIPHHIQLEPIFEFIGDFKPTILLYGGDMHDFGAVCEWVADQSRHLQDGILDRNFWELGKYLLVPGRHAAPKAKRIYLTGNHEYWLNGAIMRVPNGKGFWELGKNIEEFDARLQILPLNEPFKASEYLYYIHGHYINKYHASRTLSVYHKNIFYGHTHDIQVHTAVSPLDHQPSKAASCGCLCNRNPQYKRNMPNDWVHGFHYAYLEDNGLFWAYQVYIIQGRFYANGRMYR